MRPAYAACGAALCALALQATAAGADGPVQVGPTEAPAGPKLAPTEWESDKVADFDVACMLLGSVTFVMVIFYFLNCKDPDLNAYSWAIISSAIVTFCGVLVTSAWNGYMVYIFYGSGKPPPFNQIAIFGFAFLGWYLCLQLVLGWLSGALSSEPKSVDSMVYECKCWATLMGMITGNSGMSFWALIQVQIRAQTHDVLYLFLIIPVEVCCQLLLYKISEMVRDWFSHGDDGMKDQWETLWDKFVEDLEGSVLNMTTAHLVIQASRCFISGRMPQYNGAVAVGFLATTAEIFWLAWLGLVFAALIVIVNQYCPKKIGPISIAKVTKGRLKTICGNSVAFCWLWSVNWYLGGIFNFHGVVGGMLLALIVTVFGMSLIVLLDKISDAECTGDEFDVEIRGFVPSLSILIGFAWKQAFTNAVGSISQQVKIAPAAIETLMLTACLVTVVIPAWRMYILPHIMEAEISHIKKNVIAEFEKAVPGAANPCAPYDKKATMESIAAAVSGAGDVTCLSEASEEASDKQGLHQPLLAQQTIPEEITSAELCFAKAAGTGTSGAPGRNYVELLQRNRELELALARIRGLCQNAGVAHGVKV